MFHKKQTGKLAEKDEREEQPSKLRTTPEPIVEEPASPEIPKRGISAVIEEAEHFDDIEEKHKPKTPQTEEPPKAKPGRGKTLEIQEIEDVDNDLPKSPEIDDVQVKFKKARPAVTEEIEEVTLSKAPEEAEASIKVPQKGKPATLDSAEDEETIRKYEIQTDQSDSPKKNQGVEEGAKAKTAPQGITHF